MYSEIPPADYLSITTCQFLWVCLCCYSYSFFPHRSCLWFLGLSSISFPTYTTTHPFAFTWHVGDEQGVGPAVLSYGQVSSFPMWLCWHGPGWLPGLWSLSECLRCRDCLAVCLQKWNSQENKSEGDCEQLQGCPWGQWGCVTSKRSSSMSTQSLCLSSNDKRWELCYCCYKGTQYILQEQTINIFSKCTYCRCGCQVALSPS